MPTSRHIFARTAFPALLAAACFPASHAQAANGTWTNPAGGLWSTTTNWSSSIVANGTDALADFSTLNISSNLTVHLDSSRSIGSLLFADKTLNDHTWTLDNNAKPSNILLLDTSTGTPVINVANSSLSANLTLSGSKGLDKEGIGALFLNVPATYTGNTTIGAGKLQLGAANALPTTTSLSLLFPGSLELAGHNQFLANLTGNGTISNTGALATLTIIPTSANPSSQNPITGNINLIKSGPNTLFLFAPSTYTGTTHITAGVLVLTSSDVLPASTALTIDAGATFDISIQNQTLASLDGPGTVKPSFLVGSRGTLTIKDSNIVTSSTLLTGHMNFIKDGSGFLTLNTPATYDGNTTVSGGFLFSGVTNALPVTTPLSVADLSAFDLSGHDQQLFNVTGFGAVINQSTTPATLTIAPSLTPVALTASLEQNLSLNIPNPCNITLSGPNNFYTGNTTVGSNATLASGITNALPVTTSLSLAGTFDLNGNDQQLPVVTGNGTITNSSATQSTFQLSTAANTTLSPHIGGNINFTKSGPARLLLPTPLTFAGATTLAEGTIALGANNSLPTSTTLFMNPGTTLDLNGRSQTLKSLAGSGSIIDSTEPNFNLISFGITGNTDDITFATINAPQLELFKQGTGTLTFAGQVHAGPAFFDTGAVQFSAPGNQLTNVDGNCPIIIAPGASITVDSFFVPFLTINGLCTQNPAAFAPNTSSVNTLAIAGSPGNWTGNLDLAGRPFIVRFSPSLATLQNLAAFGLNHNAGITSSTLPPNFGIAVFSNLVTNFTTFHGSFVNNSDLLISPELLGDANIDGAVNTADLNILLSHFGQSTPNWTSGNFDFSPTIDLTDLADLLNNFGLTNPNASASQSPAPTPEPTTLALLLAPAVWNSAFRRRRTPMRSEP